MLRRLVSVSVLSLVAGALALGPAPAQAAAPAVGECRQLTVEAAYGVTDASPVVPCTGPHTSLTVGVVQSSIPLAGLAEAPLTSLGAKACYPAFWTALGGTALLRHQSDFTMIFFAPTEQERADGANWFRCDVVMENGTSLGVLPPLSTPILPARLPDSMRRCLDRKHLSVPCTRPHRLRSTGAFVLKRAAAAERIFAMAKRHCRNVAWVSWDSTESWTLGDHTATCYTRTRR